MLKAAESKNTTRDLAFRNLVNMSTQQGLDPDEYRARQLRTIKRTTPHMMIANIAVALLVSWVSWPTPVFTVVAVWAAVLIGISGFMLLDGWRRSRKRNRSDVPRVMRASPQSARRAEVYAALLGTVWGALPAATFTTAPAHVSFIIMGVVMGACGLGAFNLSRLPSAALVFASIVTSALAGAAFAIGGRGGIAAALLGSIYGIALGAMILKTHYQNLQRAVTQKALENQNEIIKLLLRDFESGTRDWLWETDAGGRLQYASERLVELVGRPLEHLLGEPFPEVVCSNQARDGWAAIASKISARRPIEIIDAPVVNQGAITWWQVSAEPIMKDDEEFEGYRGVAVDITDTRRAVDEMSKAKQAAEQASAAKSQFLAVISHELRTPLNSILGYAELVTAERHNPIDEGEQAEYLKNILEHSRHLNRLINDILDVTRIEKGKLNLVEQEVDIDEVVEIVARMCNVLAREAGVELSQTYQARGMVVEGDLTRLKQILINIISNAIKFTPRDGKVGVVVGQSAAGEPEITVTDTGIGIEASKIAAIFEPFVQAEETKARQYEGAGLGLAISRQLARLHGGDVTLISEPGKGTSVKLTLPAARLIGSAVPTEAA